MSGPAQMSRCVPVPALVFRQAELSLVLSKQTVESNSFCLDGDVGMMSLLLLYLLVEATLIIISAVPKPLGYQDWLVVAI